MSLEKAYGWIDIFCQKMFGHGITSNIREFIGQLSWSFFGGIFSSVILLLTNVLAGRWLGAVEYGKYSAVFALAQILIVFSLIGMDLSIVRKLANGSTITKSTDISASLGAVIIWILGCGGMFFLTKGYIETFFHVDVVFLSSAFTLGFLLSFRQLADSIIRGLHLFRIQAISRIIESVFIFCSFFFLVFYLQRTGFSTYLYALELGGAFLILIYLFFIRQYLTPFVFSDVSSLFVYGKMVFVAGLFGIIFGSLDKIAIAKYLDFSQLGIYSAYYTASFLLISQLGSLIDNVFFPTIARLKDNLDSIINKVDYLSLILFFPLLIGMSGIISIVLSLFGNQYPLKWQYVIGFSLLATLKMILIINTSLITVFSTTSLKLGVIYGNAINILFVVLFFLYITFFHLSISVMVILLIIYTALFIILNKWILYRVGFYRKKL